MIIVHRLLFLSIISATGWIVRGFPLPDGPKNAPSSKAKVLDFMKQFGYLEKGDENSEALYTDEGIAETIKLVQKYGAIPETGIIDNATLKLISSPRCGVPDIVHNKRTKRYAFGSKGWNKRTITYFVANWSPKLGEATVVKNIQLALDIWGRYGRLKFRRAQSPNADIIVTFGSGYHGDNYPFDGPGNILAHAFFPNEDNLGTGGDMHFDEDESWVDFQETKGEEGTDFFSVALHELGHSLGLAHSATPNSVMFPYYGSYDPSTAFQLGYDDILGIYELYIKRNIPDDGTVFTEDDNNNPISTTQRTTTDYVFTNPPTTTRRRPTRTRPTTTTTTITSPTTESYDYSTTTNINNRSVVYEGDWETVDVHKKHDPRHQEPTSPSLPGICEGYFDAVATLRDEIFIFKDTYIWRMKELGKVLPGYPIETHVMFPNFPRDIKRIDAAYERQDGMIILFTGREYWIYDGSSFVENSPRSITDYGLPDYLDNIDAVQVWARNGKTYFYKSDRFWRYNETAKSMDPGYPKHVEVWRGVPENLDAATTFRGVTYFFKDELYWTFDNNFIIITESSPMPAPEVWMGCPEDAHRMIRLSHYY